MSFSPNGDDHQLNAANLKNLKSEGIELSDSGKTQTVMIKTYDHENTFSTGRNDEPFLIYSRASRHLQLRPT